MQKTIGILGGMGPSATCDLFSKLIDVEAAVTDQDHVRICVDCNTAIPDRTAAILGRGPDPLPEMLKSAQALQGAGADVLIMPCNTAHSWFQELSNGVDVPFLSMVAATADFLAAHGVKCAGLMATDGTLKAGVYHAACSKWGIDVRTPSRGAQERVMDFIYNGIKAGNNHYPLEGILSAVKELEQEGAETIILGCTELSVARSTRGMNFPHVDPSMVVACRALQFVGASVKPDVLDSLVHALKRR